MTDAKHEAPAEGAGSFEERAIMLVKKHGDPNGSDYEQGQNDMGHRMVTMAREADAALSALRARSSAPEAREGEAVAWGRFGPDGSLIDLSRLSWGNYEGLYRHPAAPSADKLREALDEIERMVNQSGTIPKGEPRSILVALKAEGA